MHACIDKKLKQKSHTCTFYLKDKAEDWEDWIPVSSRRHDDGHHGQHVQEEHASRGLFKQIVSQQRRPTGIGHLRSLEKACMVRADVSQV